MKPGKKITFGKLDFIAARFGDLRLQELEPTEKQEERSLQIRAVTAGLEEVVDGGPLAIARHLSHHGQLFSEPDQEHGLDATLYLRKIRDPIPMADPATDRTPS